MSYQPSTRKLFQDTTPYDGHIHSDRRKQLRRRLEYLQEEIKTMERPARASHVKSECSALKYALDCLEFTKLNSYPHNTDEYAGEVGRSTTQGEQSTNTQASPVGLEEEKL